MAPKAPNPDPVPDSPRLPNIDAPAEYVPLVPSADMLTDEVDPPVAITDRGFGPTGMGEELTDEEIAAAQAADDTQDSTDPETEEATDDEPQTKPEGTAAPPSDASEEGDDVKPKPSTVPYDRFQELVAENQRLKQAEAVLQWMRDNPEQAAARLSVRTQQGEQKPKFELKLDEPSASKPFEEMDDLEKAQLMIARSSRDVLKGPLEKIGGAINDLLSFKDQLQETLTRNAVDKEGKPLHPRWDELKGVMSEVKARYSGMSDAEAYVLADRMLPQSTPMGDEMAMYNTPSRTPSRTPTAADIAPPPAPKPKRASPAALRAAKVASFGRSTPGMAAVSPSRYSAEQAAERAFDEILKSMP